MTRYHFIAIGGAVMHNLALELHALGHSVQGSDDEIFDPARTRLAQAGLLPEAFGWFPERIDASIDAVILGMHARIDNPELLKAQELGLKIYSFPEFIYHHSQNKTRLVVAGSHGKTTSTAMLMHILKQCGRDFDYLVGSLIDGYDRMVRLSDAPIMVIEGDEYLTSPVDRTPKFWHYKPHYAMITGVAWDHINVFPTFENYVFQFEEFLKTVEKNVFYFAEDEVLQRICNRSFVGDVEALDSDSVLPIYSNSSTISMLSNTMSAEPYSAPEYSNGTSGVVVLDRYHLPFFGKHNVENAAAVVKMAECLGISAHDAWTALEQFPGTAKRLEKLKDTPVEVVFRDFAHAPSKVKATVSAVREQYPRHRFIAVFELHTYSSLMPEFMSQYAGCFNGADETLVLFDPHVFEIKKMDIPSKETVRSRIATGEVFNNADELYERVQELRLNEIHSHESNLQDQQSPALHQTKQIDIANTEKPVVLLLMSSGNFGGKVFV